MREIAVKIYNFGELSDTAKERARGWWRRSVDHDEAWSEEVIEDFKVVAKIIGIDFLMKDEPLHGGGKRSTPCIWWRGFAHQGDGASFEGTYRYAKESVKRLKAHAPVDAELHRIVDALAEVQKSHGYLIECKITKSHGYQHSGMMNFEFTEDVQLKDGAGLEVELLLRELADWLYGQLQAEYFYKTSEVYADEQLVEGGYEFWPSGKVYVDRKAKEEAQP